MAGSPSLPLAVDIQQPNVGQVVTMYLIDATDFGGSLYAISPASESGLGVTWQGQAYTAFPIEATGFEESAMGAQPQPRLKVSAISKTFLSALVSLGDLVGAKVTRKRTFAQYLDGEPGADPTKHFPDDVFFIHKKIAQNKRYIEWELSTALNREGILLPRRQVLKDVDFPGVSRLRTRY